jgi:hypothetical protein
VTLVVDNDSAIRYLSPTGRVWYGEVVGRPAEEALGPKWLATVSGDDLAAILDRQGRAVFETTHRTLSGELPVMCDARRWLSPWSSGINLEVRPSEELRRWEAELARLPEADRQPRVEQLRAVDRLSRLQAIASALADTATVEELADVICGEAIDGLGAVGSRLYDRPVPGRPLALVRACGFGQGDPPTPEVPAAAEAVAATGGESWIPPPAGGTGWARCLLPLVCGGTTTGVLEFTCEPDRRFDDSDWEFARSVAKHTAESLTRLGSPWGGPPTGGLSAVVLFGVGAGRGLAARARRAATSVLADQVHPSRLADAQLVASELINNAVAHAGRPLRFALRLQDDAIVITVDDLTQVAPVKRTPDPNRSGGRGLHIIEALSEAWGSERRPWGKQVWAVVAPALPATGEGVGPASSG